MPFDSFQSGAKSLFVMGVGSAAPLAEAINLRVDNLSPAGLWEPFSIVGMYVFYFGTMISFLLRSG